MFAILYSSHRSARACPDLCMCVGKMYEYACVNVYTYVYVVYVCADAYIYTCMYACVRLKMFFLEICLLYTCSGIVIIVF